MPALDSPQFEDYAFRVKKSKHGTDASVARKNTLSPSGWEALGSLSIYGDRDRNEHNQQSISQGLMAWDHGTEEESGGQQRWSGGNMESDKDYVGWAGMANVPQKGRLLGGMAALAVAHHGRMPAADSNLSYEGARLARGAARKYGMKPLPGREMEGGFDMSSREESVRREATDAWNTHGNLHLSAAQTAGITRGVEEDYRVKKPKEGAPAVHPGQMKLL